jgi:plasmid stability protein
MPTTTIKVDAEVRDRLAARASRHGRSAGDELAALLDRLEMIEAWSQAATDYDALPASARDELRQHELQAAKDTAAAARAQAR